MPFCSLISSVLYSFSLPHFFFFISAPKNAPSATAVASGAAAYSHFVFRLDFEDWKVL